MSGAETQLQLFIEQAPVSIAMFDLNMIYVASSRRWLQTYGKGHEQLVGRSHYDINPDVPERWKELHRRGLAGEIQQCDEDLWLKDDGSKKWLRWAIHPWMDTSGKIGGIMIFAEDITARKHDEELLHEKQQQLALITSNAPGPMALLDRNHRYLYINKSYERWFEKSSAEIVGRTLEEITGPEARERAKPYLAQVLRGEQITYENHITNASGKTHHGLITVAPQRGVDGQISTTVVTIADVTELKCAELAMRQANEALEQRVLNRGSQLRPYGRRLNQTPLYLG